MTDRKTTDNERFPFGATSWWRNGGGTCAETVSSLRRWPTGRVSSSYLYYVQAHVLVLVFILKMVGRSAFSSTRDSASRISLVASSRSNCTANNEKLSDERDGNFFEVVFHQSGDVGFARIRRKDGDIRRFDVVIFFAWQKYFSRKCKKSGLYWKK